LIGAHQWLTIRGLVMTEQKLRLDVEDRAGGAVVLDVSIGRDTVELRLHDMVVGIADRGSLREWLRIPDGMFVCDELTWMWNGYTVGIHVRDLVPASQLRAHVVETLRMYL
jgi:hypothetical protein